MILKLLSTIKGLKLASLIILEDFRIYKVYYLLKAYKNIFKKLNYKLSIIYPLKYISYNLILITKAYNSNK